MSPHLIPALREVVARMWDIHFVGGCGLFFVAIVFGITERNVPWIAPLAFNGGFWLAMWADRFQFDRIMMHAHNLADVITEQQKMIQYQRDLLDALKERVDYITGTNDEQP